MARTKQTKWTKLKQKNYAITFQFISVEFSSYRSLW